MLFYFFGGGVPHFLFCFSKKTDLLFLKKSTKDCLYKANILSRTASGQLHTLNQCTNTVTNKIPFNPQLLGPKIHAHSVKKT